MSVVCRTRRGDGSSLAIGSGGGVKAWCHIPGAALLNLGDVELKEVVQPLNKLLPVVVESVSLVRRVSLACNPKLR